MGKSVEDKPYVDNYPPLRDWLRERDARCGWQVPIGGKSNPIAFIESWIFPSGREAIILVHANRLGWEVYTPEGGNSVAAALADADARLRVKS